MHNLFEPGDLLNSPYEAFLYQTAIQPFPIRPHWHHYMEVILNTEGLTIVECNEETYTLKQGDMIVLPPKSMHAIYSASNVPPSYYVIKLDLNRFRENIGYVPQLKSAMLQAESSEHTSHYFSAESLEASPVLEYVKGCVREYEQRHYGYYMVMHSYLTCLMLVMLRIWRQNGFVPSHEAAVLADNSIETITEYIDAHSGQPLKVDQLAARCNMSYSFFAKKFKQIYGRSCKEYIEYIRVTKAEDMLLFSDYDLTYISQATGFADCSHMIKTFRKYKNITPKQFRMQNTKILH